MRFGIFPLLVLIASCGYAQFGPGGVGSSANNGLWLKADDLVAVDGDSISLWPDRSGNNNDAAQNTAGRKPVYVSSSTINGRPIVRLDGANDQLVVPDNDLLDNSSGLNYFVVLRANNINGSARGILGKRISFSTPSEYAFSFFFYTGNNIFCDYATNDDRFNTSPTSFSNNTNYLLNFGFNGALAAASRAVIYSNGTLVKTASESSASVPNSNQDLAIGALNVDYGTYLGADYAEVVQFNYALNAAERIIVNNYLAAKYNITVANDFYAYQGSYGNEVAGIGRVTASDIHNDSKGPGLVRINGVTGLGNNEFLFWGHNGASLSFPDTTDVDGTVIEARLQRVWRADITGNLGIMDITFDLSSFGTFAPADLRLLIDRDGDGFADNDQTPASGTFSAGEILFNNVNLSAGDFFTLGSTNFSQTPLPVTLAEFKAVAVDKKVRVFWKTVSEINNEYFIVERASRNEAWTSIGKVPGAGNSRILRAYELMDHEPLSGLSYYRLKQTDVDGQTTYSDPRSVFLPLDENLELYPNPSEGVVHIRIVEPIESFRVFAANGALVSIPSKLESNVLDLNTTAVPPGRYFMEVRSTSQTYHTSFMVNR